MTDAETLLNLEERRCAAIASLDDRALEAILSADYVHIHANGNIDNRAGFIEGVVSNPRRVERRHISVRIYGAVAILIGEQMNHRDGCSVTGIMQQIAIKRRSTWRFVSAQMTLTRGRG